MKASSTLPYTIWVRNTTGKVVKNVRLLHPYEFMFHEGFLKDGSLLIDGIEISSDVPYASYDNLLWNFAEHSADIGKVKLHFDECKMPLDLCVGIEVKYANGNQSSRYIPLSSTEYDKQENKNEFIMDESFRIHGGVSLLISEIPAFANVLVTLYPMEVVDATPPYMGTKDWMGDYYGTSSTYILHVQNKSGEAKGNFKFIDPSEYFFRKDLKDTLVIDGVEITYAISNISLKHFFGEILYSPKTIESTILNLFNCQVPEALIFKIEERDSNGNIASLNIDLKKTNYGENANKRAFEYGERPFQLFGLTRMFISELPAGADLYIYLHTSKPDSHTYRLQRVAKL